MNYLADTVTLVRHFSGVGKIALTAKTILKEAEEGKHQIFISIVSLFEVMYLAERKRIKISLKSTIASIQKKSCYSIIDLNKEIVLLAETIPFYELHDRLILATSKYLEADILSSDIRFDEIKGLTRIWK
ncbi:MAG TPA: PIN domain-containing protein [Cyclobacteriaceae bacterium]|jgi:PIN domain nuclease of toxin-antitoxin system|nr:PIN domain-containing protein [Cyclobacteriaceae bacterium]